MKIKAVCEATGLTDRTIRHYIEEGLIAPEYSENYLGRKTFQFSEEDAAQLRDIAVLRKYGFSIPEIKEMILHPERIMEITQALQIRKQTAINEEQGLLQALSRLDPEGTYTVSRLADCLAASVKETPIPAADTQRNVAVIVGRAILAILSCIVAWLPVIVAVLIFIVDIRSFRYPVYNPLAVGLILVSLLPTAAFFLLPKIKAKGQWKTVFRYVLLGVCVTRIPIILILSLFSAPRSQTTNFRNYRYFDVECSANRDAFFQELFPKWPNYSERVKTADGNYETVYLDAHYYYRALTFFGNTYDIYAEWPLEEDAFYQEVDRVTQLFQENTPAEENRNAYHDCVTVQKDDYTCYVHYYSYGRDPVFEKVTDSYTYYIFAYDEANLRVRYLYCSSTDGGAQPYYLSLDW